MKTMNQVNTPIFTTALTLRPLSTCSDITPGARYLTTWNSRYAVTEAAPKLTHLKQLALPCLFLPAEDPAQSSTVTLSPHSLSPGFHWCPLATPMAWSARPLGSPLFMVAVCWSVEYTPYLNNNKTYI